MNDLLFSEPHASSSLTFGSGELAVAPRDGNLIFQDAPAGTSLVFGTDAVVDSAITLQVDVALGGVTVNVSFLPPVTADVAVALGSVEVSAFVVTPVRIDAAFTLGSVSVSAFVVTPVRIDAAFTLGSVSVSATAFYDNRVTAWVGGGVSDYCNPRNAAELAQDSAWRTSVYRPIADDIPWGTSVRKTLSTVSDFEQAVPTVHTFSGDWETALPVDAEATAEHQKSIPTYLPNAAGWETAQRRGLSAMSGLQAGIFKTSCEVHPWERAGHLNQLLHTFSTGGVSHVSFIDALWETACEASDTARVAPAVAPRFWWNSNLLFEFGPGTSDLVFGASEPAVIPGTVIVPVRRVYMVTNSATLTRDGVLLPTFSMSLGLDVDSWTWGFSATLPADTMASLEPDAAGTPVEVIATVNGVQYRALVESIARTREFGKSGLRIQGRGKTALLDAPYAPMMNFTNSFARTAHQLMGDVLSVNGIPMDWTVDMGLEDWLVPASVFSHSGSYISALNAIAAAAGGYIQPHASTQTLSVLPRYPWMPRDWAWSDFDLPADLTVQESITWTEKARYNRVFVSGVQAGVLGQVTLAGSAGDLMAPMVADPLITTAAAARQRGLSVLANTGRQALVSLRLPVLPATGIITPGKFIRYDGTRLGIVRSVSVDVGLPEIWQTLGVETHV